jgi:hypothetical protein
MYKRRKRAEGLSVVALGPLVLLASDLQTVKLRSYSLDCFIIVPFRCYFIFSLHGVLGKQKA